MAETIISPGVFARENDISFISPAPTAAGAAIIGPTVKGPVEIPTVVTSYNDYSRKFGVTFENGSSVQEYLTSLAVKNYFEQGGDSVLVTRIVSASATWASATSTFISPASGSTAPFVIKTKGKGELYNNSTGSLDPGTENTDNSLLSGSADNLRWEISNVDSTKGTFTLAVRRGNDNIKNKVVLETFNDLSLDPNSSNYIAAVIGDQVQAISGDASQVTATGDYPSKSNYIYVSAVNLPTINYIGNDGLIREGNLSGSLPVASSGSFHGATGTNVKAGANFFGNIATDTQGLVGADYADAITLLGNKDDYQFNIISTPGLIYEVATHKTQLDNMVSLAESRGDAIAVVDLVGYGDTVANTVSKAASINSSYAASYWPWLQMQSATGKNSWVPASVVIPGIYAFTDNSSAPWFAPAGLVRGGVTGVIQAEKRLTRTDRDTLYSGKVNPIATFPGTGIAVFGQKTLQTQASALDRVNVRRLLIELKKFIGDQARNLVFEQNTIATRNSFLATVNPYLESVVQRQGLYAFRVVMDDTNNTPDVVDRNQLVGQIFIQPAKTAEFIVLDFVVEPTGATFDA
jgi:phage tail sheath protein FI